MWNISESNKGAAGEEVVPLSESEKGKKKMRLKMKKIIAQVVQFVPHMDMLEPALELGLIFLDSESFK